MNEFKPLGSRVIVKLGEVEETTASGIIIQGASKAAPTKGIVRYKPPAQTNENGEEMYPFNVGDVVQFGEESAKAAVEIIVEGEELHVLNATTLHGYYPQ